jgi:hypothetical protein
LEIESTDFHIPSAPTTAAHLTENQNPDRRMIAPPAQMISSSSIPAAFQKIRFLMIDNNSNKARSRPSFSPGISHRATA